MGTIYEDEEPIYDDSQLGVGLKSEEPNSISTEEPSKEQVFPEGYENEESMAQSYSIDISGMNLEVEETEDSAEEDIYTPEERLRLFADKILSCCVGKKEIQQHALNKLLTIANPRLFRDENHIIFSVLFAYRGKLKKLNIDEEFVKLFLNRNRGLIQKSKGYIDISAYGEVDGSVELGYIGGVVKHFTRLVNMEELSETDFETCFEKYIIEFKTIEATKAYNQAAVILTDGLTIGRKYYFGFEDSQNWLKRKLAEIEGLVDPSKGTGFVKMSEILRNEKEDGKKPIKIADYDRLDALNKIYGGIYTGTFIQVLAPPKAGKTKFCARVCHTCAIKYGNNVTVWAQEGGKEAWTAQMRAIHFDHTYNTGKDVTEKKYGINQKVILEDSFATQELRELELSSKRDLESNTGYGSIDFIDRPFEVETFLTDIDTSVKENGSKLVIVDYLQLIGSATNMPERERIAEAYRAALVYCKDNNITFLTPGQFKQEVINELLSKGSTADADMRTSGGGSSEVFRTPDIIFTLWASTADLLNNRMKILSTPARMSQAFPEIDVVHDLGVCQFISTNN